MTDRFEEILDLEEKSREPYPNDFRLGDILVTDNPFSDAFQREAFNQVRPIIELLLQAEGALILAQNHLHGFKTIDNALQAIDKFRKGER